VQDVAGWYERFCDSVLGSPVRRALFFGASAGCAAGVELRDGRLLVVKAFQPRWRLDCLQVVSAAQRRLVAAGIACPQPEVAPLRFEGIVASVDRLLADPGMRILDPGEMSVSARGLATVALTLRHEDAKPWVGFHLMDRRPGSLYPVPHNPLFDFDLDADAAVWIDELASAALAAQAVDDSDPQLIHADWSARNIRIVDHKLVACYDWDSLAACTESMAVGFAAATWRSNGESEEDPPDPGLAEIDAYLDAYVLAVASPRSRLWRAAAISAGLYSLAYAARCEHSLQARDPSRNSRQARDTLEADGADFLAILNAR
jgi:Ser/Thr protein kinase RdoA (MazF antagonist)